MARSSSDPLSRPGRPPGMMDVARLAGVSHQTVSRVLNGHPNVRTTTRARVTAAIEALDYRRNLAARALVTGRSQTLGVVSFNTTLYGPASTLFGIEQAARDAGYFVTVASMRTVDRASVVEAVDRLMHQAVDGIIVIAPQRAVTDALAELPEHVPVVAIGNSNGSAIPAAGVDQDAGATAATQHLLDHGHETVWHVAGPGGWLEAEARQAAWQRTLLAAGCEVTQPLIGDWTARSGYEAGRVLAKIKELSAIFAANDHMALGVLRALAEAGRRVPEDVSVVGFDDVPEAAYFSPALTTIRQDFDELGRQSVAQLLDRVIGTFDAPVRASVPVELVERQSVSAR